MRRDIQITELENDDIEIQLDSCTVLWSEINGNPEKNKALVALLTKLLAEKVDKNEPIEFATHTKITYDEKGLIVAGEELSIEDLPELKLENIVDVEAIADEVNKLHGMHATTEELNKLHGLESTTAELNILHGLVASTEELNRLKGLLITSAEMNLLAGARENIQDQLDRKQDILNYKAEDSAYKVQVLSNSPNTYPSSKLLNEALRAKQDKLTATQLATLNSGIVGDDITNLVNNKLDKNEPIEAGTATKVIYDEKGLIVGTEKLVVRDIPTLPTSHLHDLNVSNVELNKLKGITVTAKELNNLANVESNVQEQISDITELLPREATEENKLADKQFVRNWVNDHAGFFLCKDDKNTPFTSYKELTNTFIFYCNGKRKPVTDNDFTVVTQDETRNNAVIMYAWIKDDIYPEGHWKYQYKVSNYYDELSFAWGTVTGNITDQADLKYALDNKQDILVNQTNIKSVDGNSLLGSGNLAIDKYTKKEIDDKVTAINKSIEDVGNVASNALQSSAIANMAKTDVNNNFSAAQTFNGDVTINGKITQSGATYETHAEKVYTTNDLIVTRDGATSGLGANEYTGFQAKLYDGTHDGQLVFSATGEARVGDVGDTEPLATRDELDKMQDGKLVKWDGTNKKLISDTTAYVTEGKLSEEIGKLPTESSINTQIDNKLGKKIVYLAQAEYESLAKVEEDTYYFIQGTNGDNDTITKEELADILKGYTNTEDIQKTYALKTELPAVPTNVSAFTNDAGYITSASLPTKVSDLTNDSGFLTEHQSLADYVKNTDYATNTTAGVIKIAGGGLAISNAQIVYITRATETDISGKSNVYKAIVPANLDYAVKTGITTNTLTLTDAEKETAKTWLGIAKEVVLTQAEYDALTTKDDNTTYYIKEEE